MQEFSKAPACPKLHRRSPSFPRVVGIGVGLGLVAIVGCNSPRLGGAPVAPYQQDPTQVVAQPQGSASASAPLPQPPMGGAPPMPHDDK